MKINKTQSLLLSCVLALTATSTHAYETDNFTNRIKFFNARDQQGNPLDATAALNRAAQARLKVAAESFNAWTVTSCDADLNHRRPIIIDFVMDQFRGDFAVNGRTFTSWRFATGLEKQIEASRSFAKYRFGSSSTANTIYDGANSFLTLIGLQPSVRVGNNMVGIDKFGHFFDSGFRYFENAYELVETNPFLAGEDEEVSKPNTRVYTTEPPRKAFKDISYKLSKIRLKQAIGIGVDEEEGSYGLSRTGVKAYGDMTAEFQGLRFWTNLLMGPKPYLVCKAGKYTVNPARSIDFAEYVHPGWDEGINCSEFTDSVKAIVAPRIAVLGGCPVVREKEKCAWIAKLPCAEFNTSPACLAIVPKGKINTFCRQDEDTLMMPIQNQVMDLNTRLALKSPQNMMLFDHFIQEALAVQKKKKQATK